MQSATASGWQQARDLTSEGIKRLYGGPLEVRHNTSPTFLLFSTNHRTCDPEPLSLHQGLAHTRQRRILVLDVRLKLITLIDAQLSSTVFIPLPTYDSLL